MSCPKSKLWWKHIVIHWNGTQQESHIQIKETMSHHSKTHRSQMQVVGCQAWETHCYPYLQRAKVEYKGISIEIKEFWFCLDQIARCVMGPKRSHVLTQPEIPEVWHVLTGTNITRTEVIELEEVGFYLQFNVPIFP